MYNRALQTPRVLDPLNSIVDTLPLERLMAGLSTLVGLKDHRDSVEYWLKFVMKKYYYISHL